MRKNKVFSIALAIAVCAGLLFAIISINSKISDDASDTTPPDDTDISAGNDDELLENGESSENGDENIGNEEIVPTKPEIKSVSFLAAGDNIVHQSVMDDARTLAKNAGRSEEYYFEPIYENLKDIISSADIAFVNQEGPIAGKALGHAGYPNFNAPDEAGTALVNVGFDIVNIANNHLLDRGEQGYKNSIEFWEKQPVQLIGGYKSEEDFNTIRYYEYEDLTIALLSYTYGTNGIYLPATSTMWVPYYFENDVVNKHTKEARENADIVIVSIHWGDENAFAPNSVQKQYCDIMVNNNVDVIIGTHPHVLQPIEWKDRPDGKKTLVAYSIGNMLSTMEYSRNMVGGLLTFDIEYTEPSKAEIINPKLIPTFCYYTKARNGLKLYEFSNFTEEMYLTHGCTLKESVSYDKTIKFVTDTIDSEFLCEDFLSFINE